VLSLEIGELYIELKKVVLLTRKHFGDRGGNADLADHFHGDGVVEADAGRVVQRNANGRLDARQALNRSLAFAAHAQRTLQKSKFIHFTPRQTKERPRLGECWCSRCGRCCGRRTR